MRTFLTAAALVALTGTVASADLITIPVNPGTTNLSDTSPVAFSGLQDAGATTSVVRGFYVSGTFVSANDSAGANQLRAALTTVNGTTTARQMTSISAGSTPTTFVTGPTLWMGSNTNVTAMPSTQGPTNSGFQGELSRAQRAPGNSSFGLTLSIAPLGPPNTATYSNVALNLLTDIITPVSGSIRGGNLSNPSPLITGARPTSFSGINTTTNTATGVTLASAAAYRYNSFTFTSLAAGLHMIGADYINSSGGASTDQYLLLYKGVFDPAQPTLNLVGLDGDNIGDANGTQGSSMFVNLPAGQEYTVVITTQGATTAAASTAWTSYVAGPVPAPGAGALLALGGIAAFRRRRN